MTEPEGTRTEPFQIDPEDLKKGFTRIHQALYSAIQDITRKAGAAGFSPEYLEGKILGLMFARDLFSQFPIEQKYPTITIPKTPWEKLANEYSRALHICWKSQEWWEGRRDGLEIGYEALEAVFTPGGKGSFHAPTSANSKEKEEQKS